MEILNILLALNAIDIISGFIKAVDKKEITSKKMKDGLINKAMIWVIVCLSYLLKDIAPKEFGINIDLVPLVAVYYVIMEAISIVENVSVYLPIPTFITNMLKQAEEKVVNTQQTTQTNAVLGTQTSQESEQAKLMKALKGDNNE